MDHTAWLWRKKSAEKSILSGDRASPLLKGYNEQMEALPNGVVEIGGNHTGGLKDKAPSTLSDSDYKEDLMKKHEKMAQEAIAAKGKVESELMSLRRQFDECLKQKAANEERLTHLDASLRECTQQLQFVREDQERRIHDAVVKVSRDFDTSGGILEERLEETTKRLAKTVIENNQLSKSLLLKERSIEELSKQRAQVESEFSALMNRLDLVERENASLKYEVRVLEKELDIRNEEREFNRRSAEISQKQHLESAKKVAKLEGECQRLRLLVRQRLPRPAAVTKMRNESEVFTREPSMKKIGALTDHLNTMEEENRILREALERKSNELQVPRNMYSQASSKLSQVGSVRNGGKLYHAPSLASISDVGSDDKVSGAESWASALISELENFRNEKLKEPLSSIMSRASEIDLMDDFVEMERIAVMSTDEASTDRLSNFSAHNNVVFSALPTKEDADEEMYELDSLIEKLPHWLQDVVKLVLKQNRVYHRDPKTILEDMKTVWQPTNTKHRYPTAVKDLRDNMNKSISKIVELVEGIGFLSIKQNYSSLMKKDGSFASGRTSESPTGYTVRVFQWKTSELENILQKFLHICYDLLSEKADMCKFGEELAFALEWILNHCFSLQDVSSMQAEFVKGFNWDDMRSEGEAEAGPIDTDCNSSLVPPLTETVVDTNGNRKEEEAMSKEPIQTVESLRNEIETLKESKRVIEDQMKSHISVNEDLDRQLSSTRAELNEARQRSFSLEEELDNKHSCFEELENTCLDLQLQLESMTPTEIPMDDLHIDEIPEDESNREDKPLRTDLEITAATEKLAECQETILNLGKQLKALASPDDANLFDKVIFTAANNESASPKKSMSHRSSLLEHMLAEDEAKAYDAEGKVTYNNPEFVQDEQTRSPKRFNGINGEGNRGEEDGKVEPLAIVPLKKQGGWSLWKKLLRRKKKSTGNKPSLPHTP